MTVSNIIKSSRKVRCFFLRRFRDGKLASESKRFSLCARAKPKNSSYVFWGSVSVCFSCFLAKRTTSIPPIPTYYNLQLVTRAWISGVKLASGDALICKISATGELRKFRTPQFGLLCTRTLPAEVEVEGILHYCGSEFGFRELRVCVTHFARRWNWFICHAFCSVIHIASKLSQSRENARLASLSRAMCVEIMHTLWMSD